MGNLREVAKRANVSISTVSRVINNVPKVDPETRERVLKAIRELDYTPNRVAQRLRSSHRNNKLIGLVLPDIQNPFYVDVIRGVESYAYAHDFAVMIGNFGQNEQRANLYLNIFLSENVDGLIMAPTHNRDSQVTETLNKGFEVVCIDRGLKGVDVDVVKVDNEGGAYSAIDYLIRLGHRRIAHITGKAGIPTTAERIAGYMAAMKEHNIEVDPTLVRSSRSDYASGSEEMTNLLDLKSPPTAVFAANNLLTLGALKTIHSRGLNIPDDISIIGFDDMYWSDSLNPPLTAVHQSGYDIGYKATEILVEKIKNRGPAHCTQVVFDTQLIVRKSCKAV